MEIHGAKLAPPMVVVVNSQVVLFTLLLVRVQLMGRLASGVVPSVVRLTVGEGRWVAVEGNHMGVPVQAPCHRNAQNCIKHLQKAL